MQKLSLEQVLSRLAENCIVGDFGSGDRELEKNCLAVGKNLKYISIDKTGDSVDVLSDFDTETLPFPDDYFDLIVSSHVIEHLRNPIKHFSELIRVCKEDGLIYLETPSDRSALCKSHSFGHQKGLILNFYDDPTHLGRPWSAQSLFRLGTYNNLQIESVQYVISYLDRLMLPIYYLKWLMDGNSNYYVEKYWKAKGWVVKALFKKTFTGPSEFNYYSFKRNKNGHYK